MKKRILLFTALAAMTVAILTSGTNGAGFGKGYNCTGSETGLGNVTGCSASGCHGTSATSGITVVLELDSAGVATTHYKHGLTYTVKISGTNTTASSLPKFGFQVCCVTGSVSAVTPINAGTFATTGLPAGLQYTPAHPTGPAEFVCNFIEHSTPLSATTGTGASGTTYVESFSWTAPAAGTGNISFWGALMGVNNDGQQTGDFWNTTHSVIKEWATTEVGTVSNNISITAYPNPVTTTLNVLLDNAEAGTYSLQVYDMNGRIIAAEHMSVNSISHATSINTSNWALGMYNLILQKDGYSKAITVIKR